MQLNSRIVEVCGVPIVDFRSADEALGEIEKTALPSEAGSPLQVNFINAHVVNNACRSAEFLDILRDGCMNLADGIGIWIGGKISANVDLANLNGTDFGLRVLEWGAARGLKIYFLGGAEGVVDIAREKLCARVPGLMVVGARNGFFSREESESIAADIRRSEADILFVCMGVPLQEIWIHSHLSQLSGVKAAFALGAFFDFYSETVKRAPSWMIRTRIEWIYRLYQEPRRLWRRYLLGNAVFIGHVLKRKLGSVAEKRSKAL